MVHKSVFFSLEEMVCKHVYDFYGEIAWQFFDPRLLITLHRIRERIGRPIYINNWDSGGQFSQRGFRCLKCELIKKACLEGRMYVSPHATGQGVDLDIQGMVASEVREYIIKNANLWPYPIRLEADVPWIHMDTRDADKGKVFVFKP